MGYVVVVDVVAVVDVVVGVDVPQACCATDWSVASWRWSADDLAWSLVKVAWSWVTVPWDPADEPPLCVDAGAVVLVVVVLADCDDEDAEDCAED